MDLRYEWRGAIDNEALERLHGVGFDHDPVPFDWAGQLAGHSLGWVTAHDGEALIGFVNVAWDGGSHAFVLDTLVTPSHRRRGIARRLIEIATDHARAAGCEWLHADYEPRLAGFYEQACGFSSTPAGLIHLH